MDMLLIHMSCHNELMFPTGKLHRQFISQLIGILRRDGSRLKGLDNPVSYTHLDVYKRQYVGGGIR